MTGVAFLRDMASAIVAATKPLTDAPAVTAAVWIASRCSIDTRTAITIVFGVFLLTGGPRLASVLSARMEKLRSRLVRQKRN